MIRRRAVAAVLAAAWVGVGVVAGAGSASAETDDQRFADAVAALGIPTPPGDDLPTVGHRVCDWLTSGLASNVNPVPTVRGVVSILEGSGLEKGQAVGLMRASVGIYCPQYTRLIGR